MRVNVTTPDCKLTTALLVWSAERQPFLTVHQVQDSAGKPSILDGRLASQAEVLKLLRSLTNERGQGGSGADSYLDPTILSVSPRLTWWRPASLAPMWFRGKDLERNGQAVQPGLVFQASEDGLKVFAVKSRSRPDPHHAPVASAVSQHLVAGRGLSRQRPPPEGRWGHSIDQGVGVRVLGNSFHAHKPARQACPDLIPGRGVRALERPS